MKICYSTRDKSSKHILTYILILYHLLIYLSICTYARETYRLEGMGDCHTYIHDILIFSHLYTYIHTYIPTSDNNIVIGENFHGIWTELLHHLRVVAHHAIHHIAQRILHSEVDAIHKL